ncbi:PIG-L family deacetylase [Streptomyces sp. VRA16 Mangrove soil]|uniref:PIG-L family deacetylase n=1 Tax=Streptomyces sp. VRA16 Mangrove soil TaxID=2817434 RepID=UPI001A9D9D9A|nr:PIG-L family deacetylase [Streptomyces sp. VRA16 Mangrove soil]MBO1335003.1 PIG-L family deacetylase [Streptomyces sp. VRA16 Mangrove soil]
MRKRPVIPGPEKPVKRAFSRRNVLLGGAAALAAAGPLTACSRLAPAPPPHTSAPSPASGLPAAQAERALLLQVLAHPDDDLYFMNPDAQRAFAAGTPLVCVYVTAGEANGQNKTPADRQPAPNKAAYSAARHQGLRQSYAAQLGLPVFTRWETSALRLRGGFQVEVNTLQHRGRSVELVHLDLAMHTPAGHMGIPALWRDRGLLLRTLVPEGSPVRPVQTYDYDSLVAVLVELFERYRPTLVHTLDPDPDIQLSDRITQIRDSEQPGYSDHADHTAVACFSWAALIQWAQRAKGGPPAFAVTSFRGYYNHHWPKNLPPQVLRPKAAHLVPYGAGPDWACGNPAGCGDYNVGGDRPLTNRKGWVRSTHYRYPGPRLALAPNVDGTLTAYGVLGLRAVRYEERGEAGGAFTAPVDLGGGPLAPVLGSATLPDGRHLVLGLRLAAIEGRGATDAREIVVLEQHGTRRYGSWTSLGNPEGADADRGRRIGVPVAVTAPDGRVHLFVRNAAQGVSTRVRETGGAWSPWRDLGGGQVQDGLTAVVGADRQVHLYGPGRDTVHHWTPNGYAPLRGLPVPADAVAAADGRLYYRGPASARLLSPGGPAGSAPDFPGFGPVAAAGGYLLGLDTDGRVQLGQGGHLTRPATDPATLAGPSLVVDRRGPTAAGLSPDARPWLWRPRQATA